MSALSRFQKFILCLALGLWVFLTYLAPQVEFRTGWSGTLTSETPAVVGKQKVDDFLGGAKEYSSLFLYADQPGGIYDNRFLEGLVAVTDALDESGYFDVESIKSIDRLYSVQFTGGQLDSRPFVEGDFLPLTVEEMDDFRRRLEQAPFVKGFLVNADASGVAIVATYQEDPPDRVKAHAWQKALQQSLSKHYELELHILDDIYLNAELDEKALSDTVLWPGLAALTIGLVCYLMCGRRKRHVLGFFLLAGLSISSLFGVVVLFGVPYSVIFVFIPILLIVTAGSDYPYFALRDHYRDPVLLVKRLAVPISLASLTTAVSSFSLTTSEIDQIRQFGLVAGVGILLTSFYSLSVLPAYFCLMDHWAKRRGSEERSVSTQSVWLGWFLSGGENPRRRWSQVLFILLLTGGVFPFALLLPWTDDVVVDYFDPAHPVVSYAERAGQEFGGIDYLKVMLSDPEGFRSPEAMQRLAEFQQKISVIDFAPVPAGARVQKLFSILTNSEEAHVEIPDGLTQAFRLLDLAGPSEPPRIYAEPVVGRVFSVADIVAYVYGQWTDETGTVLPEHPQTFDYLMNNFMGDTLQLFQDDLFNADFTQVTIDVFLTSSDTRVAEQVYEKVQRLAEEAGLAVSVGGYNMKWLTYKQHIVALKMQSIFLVLLGVGGIAMLGFAVLTRSMLKGLIAGGVVLAVVTVTVIWVLAMMFVLGIRLNVATGTVSAIGVGISVNFAVHLVYAMLEEKNLAACGDTLRSLFTDLATSSCFLFLLGSQIASIRHTGLLISLAVFCAFAFTVLLAPALFPSRLHATLHAFKDL